MSCPPHQPPPRAKNTRVKTQGLQAQELEGHHTHIHARARVVRLGAACRWQPGPLYLGCLGRPSNTPCPPLLPVGRCARRDGGARGGEPRTRGTPDTRGGKKHDTRCHSLPPRRVFSPAAAAVCCPAPAPPQPRRAPQARCRPAASRRAPPGRRGRSNTRPEEAGRGGNKSRTLTLGRS